MLRIYAIPSLSDAEVGRVQEPADVSQHQFVDFLLVEDVDRQSVLVRISQGEFSCGELRNQAVDSPSVILRSLFGDAALERGQCLAGFEGRIEAQRQPGGERRPKLPSARLRSGPHHLEL